MKLPDFDDFMERTIAVLILLGVALLFVCIYVLVSTPSGSKVIDLDAFKCTDMRTETSTTMMLSGKTLVPITTTNNVCHQWTAK